MTAYLLFPSIHLVLRAEKVLAAAGVRGSLTPVPRQLSTDCGMAWQMAPEEVPAALQALEAAGIRPDDAWVETREGWERLQSAPAEGPLS